MDIIESARRFIINQQSDLIRKELGIIYLMVVIRFNLGTLRPVQHHLALEALYYFKKASLQRGGFIRSDWDAAIEFVSNCQNLPSSNKQEWVSDHESDQVALFIFLGKAWQVKDQKKMGYCTSVLVV